MKILLYCDENLLALAIDNLLATESDLVLFNSYGQQKDFSSDIRRFEPDVVITDGKSLQDAKFNIFELIAMRRELRVLVINQEENLINSLRHQEILITKSNDLVQVLHS